MWGRRGRMHADAGRLGPELQGGIVLIFYDKKKTKQNELVLFLFLKQRSLKTQALYST